MSEIVKTPKTLYYAVIFTSIRTLGDNGYEEVGDGIVNIVSKQKGFLGAESVRDEDGFGMTISYWDSLESINAWKNNRPHDITCWGKLTINSEPIKACDINT